MPLDPRMTQCLEDGKSFVDAFSDTPTNKAMSDIVHTLLVQLNDSDGVLASSKESTTESSKT